jgi:hypothetical protein
VKVLGVPVGKTIVDGLTVTALALAPRVAAKTVWLCFPGHRPDPCSPGLSTTVYTPTLNNSRVERPRATARPPIDCFYVYPTVSTQTTGNSNLVIEPVERKAARNQVGRFSRYCRAFAPMYRQEPLAVKPTTPPNPAIALVDVRKALATRCRSRRRCSPRRTRRRGLEVDLEPWAPAPARSSRELIVGRELPQPRERDAGLP